METDVLDSVDEFQLPGVVSPGDGGEKAYIEELRKTTFGIGDGKVSKMAEILHRTIKHVSTEIYQKDVHFLSELLQNAEDNEYPVGVTPSLHLVVTYEDICKVGAPATLVIFNNECGFSRGNVEALCNIGYSTKKATREGGYIGEKGIGFKSVFLVSSQPYIISNGFRIRLNENKDKEADVGFIVPEWVDYPSDVQLSELFGVGLKLPTTAILLPLKPDKVKAVQQQLAQISPEILIFLAHMKELTIRDDRPGLEGRVIKLDRKFWPVVHHCELSTVKLSVDGVRQESASYFCCRQKVPVNLPKDCWIEQRSGVKNWAITLAFPLEGRISGGTSGDVYSFLPTEHQSGLPCLLNADFLLTSSRETIHFDSPWNEGLFEAIPQVYVTAFSIMVSRSIDHLMAEFLPIESQSVYQFVPIKSSSTKQFAGLLDSVRSALASMEVVLCFPKSTSSQPPVYKPLQCRRLSRRFCEVLVHAAGRLGCPVSDFTPKCHYIVDSEVQEKFGAQLQALGVSEFDLTEYASVLGPWVMELHEDWYVKLLHFVASELGPAASRSLWTRPLLKYVQPDGSVALATLAEAETMKKIKVPAGMPCPWLPWLCKWIQEFFKWVPIYFLPISTMHEILQLDTARKDAIWYWLHTCAKVTELSVKEYSNDLLTYTSSDPGFFILVTQYLFSIEEQFPLDTAQRRFAAYLANRLPVVDIKKKVVEQVSNASYSKKQVVLPSCGSVWPVLLPGDSWGGHLIKMHDDYLTPQCPLVNLSADALDRYTNFLRGHFFAKDLLEIDPPNCALPDIHEGFNIADDTVSLLLDWLQAIIARGGRDKLAASGEFIASIQSFPWLPTLDHGNMRPTDIFWPSTAALQVFVRPSVPFLKPSLCDGSRHGDSLALAGLVVDVNLGYQAVLSFMNELVTQPADKISKVTILNLYEGLRKMQWDCSEIEAIWIPPYVGNGNVAQWVPVKDCIAHGEDGLFQNYFAAVLSNTYDEGLLQFFVSKFHAQPKPTVEDYCKYWKLCVDEGTQLTYRDCIKLWGTIVCQQSLCDKAVWEEFESSVTVVPAVKAGKNSDYSCQLKNASEVFIPDRLELADKFASTFAGLWVPLSQAAPENLQDLYSVYSCLGAKKLSECTEIKLTEEGKKALRLTKKRTMGWICEGLFRALLGFLQGEGDSQARQNWRSITSDLIDTSDIEVVDAIEIQYFLYPTRDERKSVINIAYGYRMAYWDKEAGCLFSLNHQTAASATNRASIHLQFSHAIAEGLLAGYPRNLVEKFRTFLFGCTHVNFEVEVVNQMLRADNIQLSPEQEAFIASQFPSTASSNGFVAQPSMPPGYVMSHSILQMETKVDLWGDPGALCTMPPLPVEDLVQEHVKPLDKPFKLNPKATPFEVNGWQGTSGSGDSSKQMSPPAVGNNLSHGGEQNHVKSRKSRNGLVHVQPLEESSRSRGGSAEAESRAQAKGQSNGKPGSRYQYLRGAPAGHRAVDRMSKSNSNSVSPSRCSLSPKRGKNGGRRRRSASISEQRNSMKILSPLSPLSPSTSNGSSCDYETERLESVYELDDTEGVGMEDVLGCSAEVPGESNMRFRYGAKRTVFNLPAAVNTGEEKHVNSGGVEQNNGHGPLHFLLRAAPNRGQKLHQISPLDQTLIERWCIYNVPRNQEAKMATAVDLPAETYESLDWWRKEHLPAVKRVLGYTMARHLSMKLGPGEEKCDIDRLLTLAFLHQRYPHANGASYQRLEFLGDACLGVAVASELFLQHPNFNEHFLTKLSSDLICNSTCTLFFRSAGLDCHVITGLGKVNPEAVTDSIAADVFEATLGACYLAHGKLGLWEVRRLVYEVFLPHLQASLSTASDPPAVG